MGTSCRFVHSHRILISQSVIRSKIKLVSVKYERVLPPSGQNELVNLYILLLFLQAEPVQTMAEESRAQGTIKMSLYVKYLRAGANVLVLLLVILINVLAQVRSELQSHTTTKTVPL